MYRMNNNSNIHCTEMRWKINSDRCSQIRKTLASAKQMH